MAKRINSTILEKIIIIFTLVIIIIAFLYATVPMVLLRENYIFTIHDGLDVVAGKAQYIHDKGTFFNPNKGVDFFTADISKHYFAISYDMYTILSYGLGYLKGQILTRILGVLIGFFALQCLLKYLYKDRTILQTCIIYLASVAYVITPISPSRMFAFSSLPLVILLFLKISEIKKISWLCLFALLIPVFSMFTAALVFIICFWLFFAIIYWVKEKRPNFNLFISFICICLSTMFFYKWILYESFGKGETNRALLVASYSSNFWPNFKKYLLNGQYHSTGLHGFILLPILLLMTIWMICYYLENRKNIDSIFRKQFFIIFSGWVLWLSSAFILAFREAGFKIGIGLIDGFGWGRLVGFMRPMWYVMIISFISLKPKEKIFRNNITGMLLGVLLAYCVWMGIRLVLGNEITGVYLLRRTIPLYVQIVYYCFAILLFTNIEYRQIAVYGLILGQIIYASLSTAVYNDTGYAMYYLKTHDSSENSITFKEFFSTDLFDWIKMDINYNGELVAAYGFHPSVLMFNGFETLDRYESVHSMKMQKQFREIIAPALEKDPSCRDYYDTWGGRMYLYGDAGYMPGRNKNMGYYPLYINTDAFKKYGGKYILSKVIISNSDDLDLSLVNDYDFEDSLYHIYLYEVK